MKMNWITANKYLTIQEMENNVIILARFFKERNWTSESIAGMVGNMQTESTVNPGIWQNLTPYSGGYGLVQWTPYTKYSEWAGNAWENNGDRECERIQWELENNAQWIPTEKYPMTFTEYVRSMLTPRELADIWLKNYERPEVTEQPVRGDNAVYWYPLIQKVRTRPPNLYIYFMGRSKRRMGWI